MKQTRPLKKTLCDDLQLSSKLVKNLASEAVMSHAIQTPLDDRLCKVLLEVSSLTMLWEFLCHTVPISIIMGNWQAMMVSVKGLKKAVI